MSVFYCKSCSPNMHKDWTFHILNPTLSCRRMVSNHPMRYCDRSPLCDAIVNGAPDGIVITVLASFLQAANIMHDGCLPLHNALAGDGTKSKLSDHTIRTLIEKTSQATERANGKGYLPLHLAIEYKHSEAVVLATLANNNRYSPANVNYPEGRLLPLHRALELMFSNTVILAILAANKEAAKLPCNKGILPLQQAIESNFSKEVVLSILAANKDAAAAKDSNGILPIQKAYEFKASIEVILALLAANADISIVKRYDGKILVMGMKDAAKTEDENGVLPLHKAIKRKTSKKVLLALVEGNPDAAKVPDRNGSLPLQMAIESNLSADIILAILAANFEATKVPNINGDLPLHTAIEYKLPEQVIICILAANIDAAKVLDKSGILPLQKAVENNLSDKVILAILKGNEDAVKTKHNCDVNSVSYGVKLKEITNASVKPTNKDYSEKDICKALQSKLSEIVTHFSLVGSIDNCKLCEKVTSALDALKIVCESLKTSNDMDGVHMINDAEVPIGHSILSSDRNENEVTVVPDTSVHEKINDSIIYDETLESYGVLSLT